ncbi:hypothetical protein Tco_0696117 [Tanacetum coccineum]
MRGRLRHLPKSFFCTLQPFKKEESGPDHHHHTRIVEIEPDIENMTLNGYLDYEPEKERRLWDNVRSRRSPTNYDEADVDSFHQNKKDVIQPLIPTTLHTTPPNEDYVAPATKPILEKLLEDKILNVAMVDEEADPTRDLEEPERLLLLQDDAHGEVSCPASFRMHGIEESSSNNLSKQNACQQSVEPIVKRKGAKDAIKALTSKFKTPITTINVYKSLWRKTSKAHVDTPTCARQLMYSSTHGTCDIEARDINNSCNATLVPVLHTSHGVNTSPFDDTGDKNCRISGSSSLLMNRVPEDGERFCPASIESMYKRDPHIPTPRKQKACQQSVEPTVKRKEPKMLLRALTSKGLQSMSPRAFMQKQANAHVDTPTCARQLMYSSTHGTCDIEAMDINNSCNATPVPVLHTSHGVNTSPSNDIGDKNRGFRLEFFVDEASTEDGDMVSCPGSIF